MNVSLDSLKSDRVLKISQKDALKNTLEGIEESLKVGLKLKLNTVVVKSVNDDEILELLEYAKNRHIQIRYIEFMENTHAKSLVKGLKEREILDLIAQKYQIIATEKPKQGSSKIYTLENGYQFNLALSLRIAMIFANLAIVSVWLLMARFAHAYTIKTP